MPAGATDPDKDAALILDGATGKVLYARNETAERHPASLTKMMTLYMLFEALRAGKAHHGNADAGVGPCRPAEAHKAVPAPR